MYGGRLGKLTSATCWGALQPLSGIRFGSPRAVDNRAAVRRKAVSGQELRILASEEQDHRRDVFFRRSVAAERIGRQGTLASAPHVSATGRTLFTVILSAAHSRAAVRVRARTASLAML